MSTSTPSRRPAGSPGGGQFAPTGRSESEVELRGGLSPGVSADTATLSESTRSAFDLSAAGMFTAVESVQVIDERTGEEVETTYQVVACSGRDELDRYLDDQGYTALSEHEWGEAPDVDYATDPKPVQDSSGRRLSVRRSASLYEPS